MVSGADLAPRGKASQAIPLQGVDLERLDRIVGLRSKVVSGTARLMPGETIAGRELAADLGLRVGDRMRVQTTESFDLVQVTALVDLGAKELNRRTVIVPLRSAQNLLGLPGGFTSVDLTVRDVWAAQAIGEQLRRQLPYQFKTWQESNAPLVSALNAQSVSTSLIRAVVLMVLLLGIASVLVVFVVQKQREIGILRAMGAMCGQVLRVFLVQRAVVGALGSALGVALAWAMVALFDISLPPALALQLVAVVTVCGVLAAIAPARRAAAMDPAQAIRL
jgi:lipoprotein-releasing system permease protein